MKKLQQRLQSLGQKAAQVQQAIQSVPAKMSEVRDTVAATASQLHQLRADVQASVAGLRTEGDGHIAQALREVDEGSELLARAGYAVEEVEMEVGLAQRLIIHLAKIEEVPAATIRSLLNAQDSRKTLHGILAALLKANELTGNVHLQHLTYHRLTVYAGLTPSVRICWGAEIESEEDEEETAPPLAGTTAATPASPPPPPLPPASAFPQSSFFERPSAAPPPPATPAAPVAGIPAPAPNPAPSPTPPAAPVPAPSAGDFGRSALDRFKKMPDLSKYRR